MIAEMEKQAAGNPWVALALGRAHQLGMSTQINLADAMHSYSLAQKIPGAWYNAGLVYSQYLIEGLAPDGSGEPDNACFRPSAKSPAMKAVDCLTHAAESAQPIQARIALARIYQTGRQDVAPNPSVACHWYSKAAEEHDDEGRFQYGMCMLKGDGVPQDIKAAMHLMMEAAKSYHVEAIQELAKVFDNGQDKARAAFWKLLLAKVHPAAQEDTRRFMSKLSREDATQAQAQLKAWMLSHKVPDEFGSRFTASLPVSVSNLR